MNLFLHMVSLKKKKLTASKWPSWSNWISDNIVNVIYRYKPVFIIVCARVFTQVFQYQSLVRRTLPPTVSSRFMIQFPVLMNVKNNMLGSSGKR